jgi:8-oxo-dGTP pyrophosphatase MutT (NUDIX family)
MRFEDVRHRLARLPRELPAAPLELTPVLVSDPTGNAAVAPFPPGPQRDAAVLVLIHPDLAGEAHVVLTERASGSHRHAGQISFPGGAVDEEDESVAAAALREAVEEVGLDPIAEGVMVLGVLEPVDVRVSGFRVHPVVGLTPSEPRLSPEEREVAAVFSAPLDAFMPGAPIEIITAEREGLRLRYGAYRVGRHLVWGATATILGRLGALLANLEP